MTNKSVFLIKDNQPIWATAAEILRWAELEPALELICGSSTELCAFAHAWFDKHPGKAVSDFLNACETKLRETPW